MKLTLEQPRNIAFIQGYGQNFFTIGGLNYDHPVIVTPQRVLTDWRPRSECARWEPGDYEVILSLASEVILIGCGARWQAPPHTLLAACHRIGVGIEMMDSGAACRTYNLLASEGRRVTAALLLVG